jgi:hypothetical protein
MLAGKRTTTLAAAHRASEADRAAIRAALRPVVAQCQHDAALIAKALDGPDPEFALSLLVDALNDLPERLRGLEAALADSTHLRLVA